MHTSDSGLYSHRKEEKQLLSKTIIDRFMSLTKARMFNKMFQFVLIIQNIKPCIFRDMILKPSVGIVQF